MEGKKLGQLNCDSALVGYDGCILSYELLQLLIDTDLKFLVFIPEGIHPYRELMYLVMQAK